MQKKLFHQPEETPAKNSLKIVAKSNKLLSKNQQMFNKLTQKVEKLEKDIIEEENKLNNVLNFFTNNIPPVESKIARAKLTLAKIIDKASTKYKLSKTQSVQLKEAILKLCNEAFSYFQPTKEEEELYNKWSDISYKEEIKRQESEQKDFFAGFMSNMYGFDINADEIDDSPEGQARMQQKFREFIENKENEQKENHNRHSQRSFKKTKKQIEKEELAQTESLLKQKNMRSIYITLAKILHPDSETDPTLKQEKEEVMKKVTLAYDEKDFSTLLKLEMEWVHKTTEHLETISDDKLKLYISALKEQVAELEREKYVLLSNPRFQPVAHIAYLSERIGISKILAQKKEAELALKSFTDISNIIKTDKAKAQFLAFIQEYSEPEYDEFNPDLDFWDDDDFDDDFDEDMDEELLFRAFR